MKVILEFSQYPDPGVNAKDRFVCGGDRIRRRSIPPPRRLFVSLFLALFRLSLYLTTIFPSRALEAVAASSAQFVRFVRVLSFMRPRLDRHPGLA